MHALRCLLVDDDPIVPAYLRDMIGRSYPGAHIETVASVGQAGRALEAAVDRFGLVVLDLVLPDGSGLDLLELIGRHRFHAGTPVLMASGMSDEATMQVCRERGAKGYVRRVDLATALLPAMAALLDGGSFFPAAAAGTGARPLAALSQRLFEIASRLGAGKTVREVASDIEMSEAVVKAAIPELMRHFAVSTRGQLLVAIGAAQRDEGEAPR